MTQSSFRALALAAALCSTSAVAAAAEPSAQPEAHALKARVPGSAKSSAQPLEAPSETVMSATRSVDGRISIQCVEAANPAFADSRRVVAPATQER